MPRIKKFFHLEILYFDKLKILKLKQIKVKKSNLEEIEENLTLVKKKLQHGRRITQIESQGSTNSLETDSIP